VVLTAEDGAADTVVPRLIAAGADLKQVGIVRGVRTEEGAAEFTLPDHVPELAVAVEEYAAGLVIVDPLMAYLASATNSWRDHDTRRALRPLAAFAEELEVTVVASRHLTKQPGGRAIYRGGGSIAFTGAARAEFLVATDPDDETRRIFAPIKANLAPPQPSLAFRLEEGDNGVVHMAWGAESHHTADSLVVGMDDSERGALDEAKQFLRDELGEGPRPVKQVTRAADDAGISRSTLKRAKHVLKVKSCRSGFGPGSAVFWDLPRRDRRDRGDRDYAAAERQAIEQEEAA
jgi:hypothetical protein